MIFADIPPPSKSARLVKDLLWYDYTANQMWFSNADGFYTDLDIYEWHAAVYPCSDHVALDTINRMREIAHLNKIY
jgi:hypothetical protein